MTFRVDPKRILLIRTDRLGETLLNLPLVEQLRKTFAHAQILWMVNPALVGLLQGAPGVNRVLGYDGDPVSPWWRRAARLAHRLREERVDLAMISNSAKEFHVATWLAGIPVRVGYDRKWGFLLTHRLEDRRLLGERHEVEYNMQLLTALGMAVPASVVLRLPVSDCGEAECIQLLQHLGVRQEDRLIVVHPWTSNPRKQWPLQRARELLERLRPMGAGRVVVVGGPQERPHAEAFVCGMEPDVVNVTGQLSLPALAAVLRRARVMVTNDSGPMHLAAAVGAPVLALFGTEDPGSHPRRWGPWGDGHTVIHKPLEQIAVDDVLAAVQPYL